MQRSWIKWGIAGGVIYNVADLVSYLAVAQGWAGGSVRELIASVSVHLFPTVWLNEFLPTVGILFLDPFEPAWLVVMGLANFLIGFAIGSLIAAILNARKPI